MSELPKRCLYGKKYFSKEKSPYHIRMVKALFFGKMEYSLSANKWLIQPTKAKRAPVVPPRR
jgi:hypothetical protein